MPPKSHEWLLYKEVKPEGEGRKKKYQCMVCCMENMKKRERDDPDAEFVLDVGTGRYEENITNIKTHLQDSHKMKWNNGNPSETVQAFKVQCTEMGTKRGWNSFFCEPKSQRTLIDFTKKAAALVVDDQPDERPLIDRIVYYFASSYTSFSQVENTHFLQMFPKKDLPVTALSRRSIRAHTIRLALSKTEQFLLQHRKEVAMLAIDIGTVWRRYVGVCLHFANAKPILLHLQDDKEVVGGFLSNSMPEGDDEVEETGEKKISLSGEACAALIEKIMKRLKNFDIVIGSITTDNGSNMVSMGESSFAAENKETFKSPVFHIRCACHVFQLMVRALLTKEVAKSSTYGNPYLSTWQGILWAVDACGKTKSLNYLSKKFPKLQETRWNCQLELARVVQKVVISDNDVYAELSKNHVVPKSLKNDQPKILIKLLEGFEVATKMTESHSADMISVLLALSKIDFEVIRSHKSTELNLLIDTHFEKLASPAMVIVAYFVPVYLLSDISIKTPEVSLLQSVIGDWLKKTVVEEIAFALDIDAWKIAVDWEIARRTVLETKKSITRDELDKYWDRLSTSSSHNQSMKNLMSIVRAISEFNSSEAEVERVFRRTKLTVPTWRKRMTPSTVEALVQLNVFSKIDEPEETTQVRLPQVVDITNDNDNDNDNITPAYDDALADYYSICDGTSGRHNNQWAKYEANSSEAEENNLMDKPPSDEIKPAVVIEILRIALHKLRPRGTVNDNCGKCQRHVEDPNSPHCGQCFKKYHALKCVNVISGEITCDKCKGSKKVPWW